MLFDLVRNAFNFQLQHMLELKVIYTTGTQYEWFKKIGRNMSGLKSLDSQYIGVSVSTSLSFKHPAW